MTHVRRRAGELNGLKIELEYIVVNDGGEFQLIAWEPSPSPDPPDLVINRTVDSASRAVFWLDHEIRGRLGQMMASKITCHNCED